MITKALRYLSKTQQLLLSPLFKKLDSIENKTDTCLQLCADLLQRTQTNNEINFKQAEFKVYSQWGQDGLIQHLIHSIDIANKTFIEFGVEDYTEANTRYLLINNNWSELILDGSLHNINRVRNSSIFWKYNLQACQAFITSSNINSEISKYYSGDIGLLSIDIDGNDYWVWEALNVVSPSIVICEYNSLFGCKYAVSTPYAEDFSRSKAHYSNLYFGASLPALCHLASRKGYIFIGCNRAGNDAFFVRKDVAINVSPLSPQQGYVQRKSRESRSPTGGLIYLAESQEMEVISEMPLINIETGQLIKVKDLNEPISEY